MNRRTERVSFPGAHGDRLAARVEMPPGAVTAYALFAHCFTCSKDLKAVHGLSAALAERGFAVMRFDFTGLGESEGEFADTNFSSNLEDLVAAADYLRSERRAPRLLIGHSLGGAAVLAAAERIPESRAVATLGAPSETEHLKRTLLREAPELEGSPEAMVQLGGRRFRIRRQLLDDLEGRRLEPAIARLDRALLIMHSPVDAIVGVEHARRIFEAARHPKSFVSLDGADHLLIHDPRDAHFAGEVLAAWAGRYVSEDAEEAEPVAAERHEEGVVTVTGGASGYAARVMAGAHELAADEPEAVGGTGTGPSPYGYLLAALGACKVMTMRMYADRKEWPLEGSRVRLRHGRVHARDCEECQSTEGRVDRIEVELEVDGPLDEEQRRRILEIADRCPVHRTLTTETVIVSRPAGTPSEG